MGEVQGTCDPRFGAVREALRANLESDELRLDLGTPETMVEALKLSLNYVEAKRKTLPSSLKQEAPPIPALVD